MEAEEILKWMFFKRGRKKNKQKKRNIKYTIIKKVVLWTK